MATVRLVSVGFPANITSEMEFAVHKARDTDCVYIAVLGVPEFRVDRVGFGRFICLVPLVVLLIGTSDGVRDGRVFLFGWALAFGHIIFFVTSTAFCFVGGTSADGSALGFDDNLGFRRGVGTTGTHS